MNELLPFKRFAVPAIALGSVVAAVLLIYPLYFGCKSEPSSKSPVLQMSSSKSPVFLIEIGCLKRNDKGVYQPDAVLSVFRDGRVTDTRTTVSSFGGSFEGTISVDLVENVRKWLGTHSSDIFKITDKSRKPVIDHLHRGIPVFGDGISDTSPDSPAEVMKVVGAIIGPQFAWAPIPGDSTLIEEIGSFRGLRFPP